MRSESELVSLFNESDKKNLPPFVEAGGEGSSPGSEREDQRMTRVSDSPDSHGPPLIYPLARPVHTRTRAGAQLSLIHI